MSSQIKIRRGTAAQWSSTNPVLGAGEPGYETDTRKIKYGDGAATWNTLSYAYVDTASSAFNAPIQYTPTVLAGPIPTASALGIITNGLSTATNLSAAGNIFIPTSNVTGTYALDMGLSGIGVIANTTISKLQTWTIAGNIVGAANVTGFIANTSTQFLGKISGTSLIEDTSGGGVSYGFPFSLRTIIAPLPGMLVSGPNVLPNTVVLTATSYSSGIIDATINKSQTVGGYGPSSNTVLFTLTTLGTQFTLTSAGTIGVGTLLSGPGIVPNTIVTAVASRIGSNVYSDAQGMSWNRVKALTIGQEPISYFSNVTISGNVLTVNTYATGMYGVDMGQIKIGNYLYAQRNYYNTGTAPNNQTNTTPSLAKVVAFGTGNATTGTYYLDRFVNNIDLSACATTDTAIFVSNVAVGSTVTTPTKSFTAKIEMGPIATFTANLLGFSVNGTSNYACCILTSAVAGNTPLSPGMLIFGPGLPVGAWIASVNGQSASSGFIVKVARGDGKDQGVMDAWEYNIGSGYVQSRFATPIPDYVFTAQYCNLTITSGITSNRTDPFVHAGSIITGTGVADNTMLLPINNEQTNVYAPLSGATSNGSLKSAGASVWPINIPQTVAATTMYANWIPPGAYVTAIDGGYSNARVVLSRWIESHEIMSYNNTNSTEKLTFTTYEVNNAQLVGEANVSFPSNITVTSTTANLISPGTVITGTGISPGTYVTAGPAGGGTGSYSLNQLSSGTPTTATLYNVSNTQLVTQTTISGTINSTPTFRNLTNSDLFYIPAANTNWNTVPTTVGAALDELISRIKTAGY